MADLMEMVNSAVMLEPQETVVDGWSAVHLIAKQQNFGSRSFDYEGYLILTSHRLIFVSTLLLTPVKVVPGLCFRLEEITGVKVDGRELAIPPHRFKLLGKLPNDLQDRIELAVIRRFQETRRGPLMNEVLRPERTRARTYEVQEERYVPRERIRLLQCQNCGVWNPSDMTHCESCGKRVGP
jgi:hypothetical protein